MTIIQNEKFTVEVKRNILRKNASAMPPFYTVNINLTSFMISFVLGLLFGSLINNHRIKSLSSLDTISDVRACTWYRGTGTINKNQDLNEILEW